MKRTILMALLGLLLPVITLAVPLQIPYSGQLSESGSLVMGSRDLTISVYADSTGGSALYSETFAGVSVRNGVYHLNLNPDQSVWDGSVRWLGISVNGGTELTPRTKIGSVPYAVRAGVAERLVSIPEQPFPGSTILTPAQQFQVNSWVGNVFQTWTLCYRKSVNGASPTTFHNLCDNRGPSLTVVQLVNGYTIGGYTDIAWTSSCAGGCLRPYGHNFIFSLTSNKKYSQGGELRSWSVYHNINSGPCFGGGPNLFINEQMDLGYSYFPYGYTCNGVEQPPNPECQIEFCGAAYPSGSSATELEVWVKQ